MNLPNNPSESTKRRNPKLFRKVDGYALVVTQGEPYYGPEIEGAVPYAQLKPDEAAALVRAATGKDSGLERTRIRFTGYRVRLLDPDNFAGSVKDLLDGIRHAHLIADDSPAQITLETNQVQVKSFKEERTEIEIEYP